MPIFETDQIVSSHYDFFMNNRNFRLQQISPIPIPSEFISRFIEAGQLQTQIISLQQQLSSFLNLDFYTDGSVIDIGSERCSMAFALIQTNINSPLIKFSATIEKWCSSVCAELAAVLVALLISPLQSSINIYTDCKSVIDHHNNLSSSSFNFSTRNFFKESTNNLIWFMIKDIIYHKSITLFFHKVKSHSGDLNNELVDKLACSSHGYNSLSLNLNPLNFTSITYFPCWKNILIENNLRHFISDVSRNIGFEKFLQLRRNSKYVNLDIDWGTTFFILNDEESTTQTSFFAY